MIGEYEYNEATSAYSRGAVTFAELMAIIQGKVALKEILWEAI